jgi:hypothetical protein
MRLESDARHEASNDRWIEISNCGPSQRVAEAGGSCSKLLFASSTLTTAAMARLGLMLDLFEQRYSQLTRVQRWREAGLAGRGAQAAR